MAITPPPIENTAQARKWTSGQKWLLNVALFALLIGINVLYNVVDSWQPVLTGAPEQVLYATSFDEAENPLWQTYQGRLSSTIAEGALTLELNSEGRTTYSLVQGNYADFDLTVNATTLTEPIDNGFGVVFRLSQNTTSCTMPFRILCDLANLPLLNVALPLLFRGENSATNGYYMFLISSDGYYSVWQSNDSDQARKVSTWIASDVIRQGVGEQNTLRVVARGDKFRFFINEQAMLLCIPDNPDGISTYSAGTCFDGQMLDELQSSDFAIGQVGVVAQTTTGGIGVTIAFEDVVVRMHGEEIAE